ncbi:hypothetical protein J6590_017881 [Homalodisca vitripennis]|nr:hypothetical protein J6590_017881 [Homalodisca vitripennis]
MFSQVTDRHSLRYRPKYICAYCGECDATLHTVFVCPRWEYQRKGVEENLGRALTVESIVALMVESEDNWCTIADCLGEVMR